MADPDFELRRGAGSISLAQLAFLPSAIDLEEVDLRWYGSLHRDQKVCLNLVKKDQLCAIMLMNTK